MWYLSRTPFSISSHSATQAADNHGESFSLRNSIFPISESGNFQKLSIIRFSNNNDDGGGGNLWDFFAYFSSPMQIHSVVVPRSPSFRIQVIMVLCDICICIKLTSLCTKCPFASLCTYTCRDNQLSDVPSMHCEDRNLISAASAFLDGFLYIAGGIMGGIPSDVEPSAYLNTSERLNLTTWKWQTLPDMQNHRAFGTGLAHRKKFYVVGGSSSRNENLKRSAEVYDPKTNTWNFVKTFVPKEADGYAISSFMNRLLILTWSDRLGVKLWLWTELPLGGGWRLISFFPNQQVERTVLRQNGACLMRFGSELWVLVGKNYSIYQVGGMCAWPVLPAPLFRPRVDDGLKIQHKGHIYALSFTNAFTVRWRQIPVYTI